MRMGRNIEDLGKELDRQHETKRDFMVPASQIRVVDTRPAGEMSAMLDDLIKETQAKNAKRRNERELIEREDWGIPAVQLEVGGAMEVFPLSPHAHSQMAERLGIPHGFYQRLLTPDNRVAYHDLVGHFLAKQDGKRMLRVLDGKVRADLSDAYRPLDNMELLMAILPALKAAQCRIVSCDVTDTRMYIKAVSSELSGDLGDPRLHIWHSVQGGISISNSEVGKGRLVVEGLMNVRICSNAVMTGTTFKKTHLGARAGDLDEASEYFSDATREADDVAFFGKVKDVVGGLLTADVFTKTLARLNGQLDVQPVADPVGAMEMVKRKYMLNDIESIGIRNAMIQGSREFGLGKWGLSNAITEFAKHDDLSYDRATELEQLGGRVIEMPKAEWKTLAEAAA